MRILIFGASGRTGQVLDSVARQSGYEVLAPAHAECPLEQSRQLSDYVLASGAGVVVNCAAISGLEACAADPLQAHLVNAVAPAAMALACRHTGARFVHLSTDYVLDGRRAGVKDEGAKCRPINCYGESKREGELQTLEALPGAVVARVSWVCGNPARPSFIESTVMRALEGQPLAAVADKFSYPTAAEDIARAVLALAAGDYGGIVHLTSSGEPLSWWHCATLALQAAVEQGALAAAPPVQQQQLDGVPFFREPRPRHTAMDTTLLTAGLGIAMPTARQTISNAVEKLLRYRAAAAHVSQRFGTRGFTIDNLRLTN
ncbi:MAG: NAD(P)-dependent oxidoreductase [Akkermansia sp.]|nr:NAD(P)-dependent oxidoreductase [Akkermansia sp.]MBR2313352.1 NAD(P)-dependent oxidoreductase [Akkermansia sp.]